MHTDCFVQRNARLVLQYLQFKWKLPLIKIKFYIKLEKCNFHDKHKNHKFQEKCKSNDNVKIAQKIIQKYNISMPYTV